MSSIFTKIIRGELPCEKILEDDRFFSFLDIRPISPGHTLVIPKIEVDYIFDLPDDLLGGIFQFSRPIAKAIEKVVSCERVGIMVAGLEVPHAHVHLVPIRNITDLNFSNAKPTNMDSIKALAQKIRTKLQE